MQNKNVVSTLHRWAIGFQVFFLLLSGGCIVDSRQESFWFTPLAEHKILELSGLEMVWVREAVFARDDRLQPVMTASQGGVYYLGGLDENDRSAITAIDALTGDLMWQHGYGYRSVIFASPSALYVGNSGGASVAMYDLGTGKAKWEISLPGTRGFIYLLVNDETLFAQTSPDKFFVVDATTGEIVQQMEGSGIFISGETVTYQRSIISSMLEAVDTSTQHLLWEIDVGDAFQMIPAFTEKAIFILSDIGGVYCVNRQTGQIEWNTQNIVLSNIAVARDRIYFLARNGELLELDIKTGKEKKLVQFDTEHFILNGEAHIGGYYVAYDTKTEMLFAYTGDSAQLFAFRIADK